MLRDLIGIIATIALFASYVLLVSSERFEAKKMFHYGGMAVWVGLWGYVFVHFMGLPIFTKYGASMKPSTFLYGILVGVLLIVVSLVRDFINDRSKRGRGEPPTD